MKVLRLLFFAAVALFLAAPLAIVLGVSVNEKQDLAFPPVGFSISWYALCSACRKASASWPWAASVSRSWSSSAAHVAER